jgi:hypothetical protein
VPEPGVNKLGASPSMISIGSDHLTLMHEDSTNKIQDGPEEESYLPTVGRRNNSLLPPSPKQNKYLVEDDDTMHKKRGSVGGQPRLQPPRLIIRPERPQMPTRSN